MREEPEPLVLAHGFAVDRRLVALASVLGDGAGDGAVEAPFSRPKSSVLIGALGFHGELGDRLADVAVVVHHLRDRQPLEEQVVAVQERGLADLEARRLSAAQRVHQLIQEERDAVIDSPPRSGRATIGWPPWRDNGE